MSIPIPVIDTLSRIVETVIDRVVPDRVGRLKAKQEFEVVLLKRRQEIIDAAKASDAGQVEVNKIEAASDNLFKSGWRPSVGWVCVTALATQFIVAPLLPWLATVFGADGVPPIPALDLGELLTLLFGLLGLGALRTVEKGKGVA